MPSGKPNCLIGTHKSSLLKKLLLPDFRNRNNIVSIPRTETLDQFLSILEIMQPCPKYQSEGQVPVALCKREFERRKCQRFTCRKPRGFDILARIPVCSHENVRAGYFGQGCIPHNHQKSEIRLTFTVLFL